MTLITFVNVLSWLAKVRHVHGRIFTHVRCILYGNARSLAWIQESCANEYILISCPLDPLDTSGLFARQD